MRYTLAHKVKLGINPFVYFSLSLLAYVFYLAPPTTKFEAKQNIAQIINEKKSSKVYVKINGKGEYFVNKQLIDSVKLAFEIEKAIFRLRDNQKVVVLHVEKQTRASQIAFVASKVQEANASLKLSVE